MSFAPLLERSFAYCARFAIAARNLGWKNALRVFIAARSGSGLCSMRVPRLKRTIFYRGSADKGVIAHFFYPGTRILDTPAFPARVIVDAGANIGIETIRLRHFFPQARILAIEASVENYRVLARNIADDKGHVEALNYGVWSSELALRLQPGGNNEAFSVRPVEPGEPADLQAISMNEVLQRVGGEIDILKMDIEGSEYEVFSKNTDWVDHVKAFVFECPDRDHPGASAQIFRTLAHRPFDTFISGENLVLIRKDTGWDVETTAYL